MNFLDEKQRFTFAIFLHLFIQGAPLTHSGLSDRKKTEHLSGRGKNEGRGGASSVPEEDTYAHLGGHCRGRYLK